jgi:DNA polymerase-1
LAINGRLHPQFNQLKGEDYGAVTGRFSGSLPNLQFIPNRDPVIGPLTRSLFLPEVGCLWGRADYSQIEIRILAHYAMGIGAKEIRSAFIADPFLDYHQWGADKSNIDRKRAKTINFGVVYGMGAAKLALSLGITFHEADKLLKDYYRKLPFLKETTQTAMRVAGGRGYVKTLLGRRRRFPVWEPSDWELSKKDGFKSTDPVALRKLVQDVIKATREKIKKDPKYPKKIPAAGVRRAYTYKAFNAVDQGTAADIMKKAMVDIWESGLCEELPQHITVHDELGCSVPDNARGKEAYKEMVHIMANTVPLKVPVVVDSELGPNWGEAEDFERAVSKELA